MLLLPVVYDCGGYYVVLLRTMISSRLYQDFLLLGMNWAEVRIVLFGMFGYTNRGEPVHHVLSDILSLQYVVNQNRVNVW